jgi:hypothetical protein
MYVCGEGRYTRIQANVSGGVRARMRIDLFLNAGYTLGYRYLNPVNTYHDHCAMASSLQRSLFVWVTPKHQCVQAP